MGQPCRHQDGIKGERSKIIDGCPDAVSENVIPSNRIMVVGFDGQPKEPSNRSATHGMVQYEVAVDSD